MEGEYAGAIPTRGMKVTFDVKDFHRSAKKVGKFSFVIRKDLRGALVDICKNMEENLRAEAPRGITGHLQDSPKVEPVTENIVSVKIASYAGEVEEGHVLLLPRDETRKLKEWAMRKNPPRTKGWYYWLLLSGEPYYTHPNPFISRAMAMTMREIPKIVKRKAQEAIAKGMR